MRFRLRHRQFTPSSMGGYFASISRVFQILANRLRENTSKRVQIVNLEVYLQGNLRGNLWGRSTSLLLYILVPVRRAREIPAHGTAGTAHTSISRGRVSPSPYSPMELGGKVCLTLSSW